MPSSAATVSTRSSSQARTVAKYSCARMSRALHDSECDDGVEVVEARLDEAAIDVVGLRRDHEAPRVEPAGRLRLLELDVDHVRTEGFDMRNRFAHQALDLGIAVFPEHGARHADVQAGDTAVDPARHVVGDLAAGRGIRGVVALNRFVDDRGVGRVAGQRGPRCRGCGSMDRCRND